MLRTDYINSYFKINGEESTHYGLHISGSATYNAPKRRRNKIDIPGRNGSLIIDEGGYENTPHIYPMSLIFNYENNIERVRNWLTSFKSYFRLEDSYHPGEFYHAIFEGPYEPIVWRDESVAKVDLIFERKPQRFLTIGEKPVEFTESGTIKNPTLEDAKPLLRVYGNGILGIGSTNIAINGITDYVDIDVETMDCYRGLTPLNNNVAFSNEPILKGGDNGVALGTGITKVVITPRWWKL